MTLCTAGLEMGKAHIRAPKYNSGSQRATASADPLHIHLSLQMVPVKTAEASINLCLVVGNKKITK